VFSGERPSPGAARPEGVAIELFTALENAVVAVDEDGHTPPDTSKKTFARRGFASIEISMQKSSLMKRWTHKGVGLAFLAVFGLGLAWAADKSLPEGVQQGGKESKNATTNEVAVVGFWPDVAPNTVDNFKKLARKGFYDGSAFHRIIKGFMIQGGDPLTKDLTTEGRWGTGGPGYQIKAEFNEKPHVRGVISMARSAHPDSAGSQFFICLGEAKSLDHKYTAFGSLIRGDDVLGKIGDTPTTIGPGGENSKPTTRVAVESIKIVPEASIK